MRKNFLTAIIVFAVVLLCGYAVCCPTQTYLEYSPDTNPDSVYKRVASVNNCKMKSNGDITVTDDDAFIVIGNINGEAEFAVLRAGQPFKESGIVQLFIDCGEGINEMNTVFAPAVKGRDAVCFAFPKTNLVNARIDADFDYNFKDFETYSSAPVPIQKTVSYPKQRLIFVLLLALVAAILAFFADKKFGLSKSLCDKIYKSRKSIFKHFVWVLIILLVCLVIYKTVFIKVSANAPLVLFVLTFGLLLLIYCLVQFKDIEQKSENVFLALCLILGTMFIFAAPFGHNSPDVDIHYQWALDASYFGKHNVSFADFRIAHLDFWSSLTPIENATKKVAFNSADLLLVEQVDYGTTVAHFLPGVFIAIGRLFKFSFYRKYILGEFASLLTYALVSYFGISKLKSGKMIFSVFALMPQNLFLATNYSYDYWVTAFTLAGTGYFVGALQQPEKKFSSKNTLITCALYAIASLPKLVYITLLAIPFFVPKKKLNRENRKKHYLICCIAVFALLLLFLFKSALNISGGGDARGGDTSTFGQINFILTKPFDFIMVMLRFTKKFFSFGMLNLCFGNLAYLGVITIMTPLIILLIAVIFTDRNIYDSYSSSHLLRIISVIVFATTFCMIAGALYISFTPVGHPTVNGVQQRYIIPVLIPLVFLLPPTKPILFKRKTLYNFTVLTLTSFISGIGVLQLYLPHVVDWL